MSNLKIFPDFEVPGLNLLLCFFKGFIHPNVCYGLALFKPEFPQHAVDPVGAEYPHQVVFQTQEKNGFAPVALTTRAARS